MNITKIIIHSNLSEYEVKIFTKYNIIYNDIVKNCQAKELYVFEDRFFLYLQDKGKSSKRILYFINKNYCININFKNRKKYKNNFFLFDKIYGLKIKNAILTLKD